VTPKLLRFSTEQESITRPVEYRPGEMDPGRGARGPCAGCRAPFSTPVTRSPRSRGDGIIRDASVQIRTYQALTVATASAAYLLILLGGLVRISGAGLACPDWPLCHGRIVPPLEGPVLIEYMHRLVAASVSLLVVLTTAAAVGVRTRVPGAVAMASSAIAIVAVQIILGALTVKLRLSPALVTVHLGVANLFLAVLLIQAVGALRGTAGAPPATPSFRRLTYAAMAATYVMILIGGYVASSGAGLACPDLPLCRGASAMPGDPGAHAHMLHRGWSLVVLVVVLAAARAASRTGWPAVAVTGRVAAGLVAAQFALGILNVATRLAPAVRVAHLGMAALLFGTLVVLSRLVAPAPKPIEAAPARKTSRALPIAGGSIDEPARTLPWTSARGYAVLRGTARTAGDYLALMKPRIIMLLLVTTATTMIVASPHRVDIGVLLLTLLGGTLAAGSANAFNMFADRDIDAVMQRTCLRPVPAGRIRPIHALGFGVATGVLSVAVMAWGVNTLSAVLSTAGILFYVGVYTLWLKRTTPQNIVIGGAAGAVPPLVGWAAATGHLALPALVLFAIVFFWTPPHFWALALGKTEDYRAAGVPMLPLVRGVEETRKQILLYSLVLAATTLLLYIPLHTCGALYLGAALLLDGVFVGLAALVARGRTSWAAPALFGYSILYLGLLFGAMVIDRLILG
jgi:heme o synthase